MQVNICMPEDFPEDIRNKLNASPGTVIANAGRYFALIGDKVFCFPDDEAGKMFAAAITDRHAVTLRNPASSSDLYVRILTDTGYQPLPDLLRQYSIQPDRKRCTAVFRTCSGLERDLYSLISSMAPVEEKDAVVPIDDETAVLIKDLEGQSADDMAEFTEALIGTLETEGIFDVRAGIGRECYDLTGLRESYFEGSDALLLGMRYHRQERVYEYDRQTLERIIDTIPEDKKKAIRSAFFGDNPKSAISNELLETVRVFFRNDLNLTAASKQLFIHRNTLNYRLDKIKKDFGLDLRSFEDAVIFRIISGIQQVS